MVAQGEEVVGKVHAVVVLDGGQVGKLEKVLSGEIEDNRGVQCRQKLTC